jgi:hypothetical protein
MECGPGQQQRSRCSYKHNHNRHPNPDGRWAAANPVSLTIRSRRIGARSIPRTRLSRNLYRRISVCRSRSEQLRHCGWKFASKLEELKDGFHFYTNGDYYDSWECMSRYGYLRLSRNCRHDISQSHKGSSLSDHEIGCQVTW